MGYKTNNYRFYCENCGEHFGKLVANRGFCPYCGRSEYSKRLK